MNEPNPKSSYYISEPAEMPDPDTHISTFSSLSEIYDSPRGGIRLLTGLRYGKLHILKGLRPESESDPVRRTMLRKEFEVGVMLDHPNIRRTLGFENVAGVGECIVMEYVDGVPLGEAISRGLVDAANLRSVVRQLASAVEYLHSKQIIHRDLKPGNILVTFTGSVVKVIDFSMADGGEFSVLKYPGGTRGYMAPEQQAPDAAATVEADIYSLGKIIGEMAARLGDDELTRIAARCANTDPKRRPHSIAATGLLDLATAPLEGMLNLQSSRMTRMLLWVVGVLAVCLALLVFLP